MHFLVLLMHVSIGEFLWDVDLNLQTSSQLIRLWIKISGQLFKKIQNAYYTKTRLFVSDWFNLTHVLI